MLLVTGITGHSGRYFLQELITHNYQGSIRCIVREKSDTKILIESGLSIEIVVGELTDQEFVDRSMIDVDVVFHIASIFYSEYIINAVVKSNVKRVIMVHTTGIYSKFKSASEEYKKIETNINKIIDDSALDVKLLYLRPTMIYGYIGDRNMIVFIKMVDKLRLFPVIEHGNSTLQPVNGRDLGHAYYQVLTNNKVTQGDYILSGEKPIMMIEMFKIISSHLGKKTIFLHVPLGVGTALARGLRALTLGKIDYVEKVQRMAENRDFQHDEAYRDFGFTPMSFEDGVRLEIEEYLQKVIK